MLFLAYAETAGLLVTPVGLQHLRGDLCRSWCPSRDGLAPGLRTPCGARCRVRPWSSCDMTSMQEADGVCAVLAVLSHSLGEVCVQGVVVVNDELALSAEVSEASAHDLS